MFQRAVIAKAVQQDFKNDDVARISSSAPVMGYGTAGFRGPAEAIHPIAYRCLFLLFCRGICHRQAVAAGHTTDHHRHIINPSSIGDGGMMITASHNPAPDNGLKIVDADAGMLAVDWEADATALANAKTAEEFAAAVVELIQSRVLMSGSVNKVIARDIFAPVSTPALDAANAAANNINKKLPGGVEGAIWVTLRDRPIRIHVGRDTRPSSNKVLKAIYAAVEAMNKTFAPIISDATTTVPMVVELVDHGIITTPTLHAMVYWNRYCHELPVAELALQHPAAAALSREQRSGSIEGIMSFSVSTTSSVAGRSITTVQQANRSISGGTVTTPRGGGGKHTTETGIKESIAAACLEPVNPTLHFRLITKALCRLWREAVLANHSIADGNGGPLVSKIVVIDCSNGVGGRAFKHALDAPLSLTEMEGDFLDALPNAPQGQQRVSIRTFLKLITGLTFEFVCDNEGDASLLNKDCGADHCQKTRKAPTVFGKALLKLIPTLCSMAPLDAHATSIKIPQEDSPATLTAAGDAVAKLISSRVSFYCFDGDADRVVSFAPVFVAPKAGGVAIAGGKALVEGLRGVKTHPEALQQMLQWAVGGSGGQAFGFELLDGDRMSVLFASLVRHLMTGAPTGSGSNSALLTVRELPRVGVVQTAYANGASTQYIRATLHLPTVCAATGVKHLHPKAEELGIGIYFEANGHGTALCSPKTFASKVRPRETPTSHEEDDPVPPTVAVGGQTNGARATQQPAQAAGTSSVISIAASGGGAQHAGTTSSLTSPREHDEAGADAAIIPARYLAERLIKDSSNSGSLAGSFSDGDSTGHVVRVPKAVPAAASTTTASPSRYRSQPLRHLLLLRYVLSQCCGDAIGDMLACELALAALQWNASHWLHLYEDLPSITGKTTVPDPSRIHNNSDQTKVVSPAALQAGIDKAVAEVGGSSAHARSFVRPSGTEPIVRIYAEAATPQLASTLHDKVAAVVKAVLS